VEDNNSNLELVEQIVSMSQDNIHLVHTAYGGMAVAKAKECKPSLILLDLNLPDSHGSQVIQWLKNDEVTQHIPVIVVSADAMPDQVKELTRLGAVNYLTKPLEVQVFLTEIRKYLR
jgi:CheY-like chemotaxis protein